MRAFALRPRPVEAAPSERTEGAACPARGYRAIVGTGGSGRAGPPACTSTRGTDRSLTKRRRRSDTRRASAGIAFTVPSTVRSSSSRARDTSSGLDGTSARRSRSRSLETGVRAARNSGSTQQWRTLRERQRFTTAPTSLTRTGNRPGTRAETTSLLSDVPTLPPTAHASRQPPAASDLPMQRTTSPPRLRGPGIAPRSHEPPLRACSRSPHCRPECRMFANPPQHGGNHREPPLSVTLPSSRRLATALASQYSHALSFAATNRPVLSRQSIC